MASITTFAAFSSRGFGGGGAVSLTLPTGGNYIIDNNGFGKRVHVFTTSGSFTIPENVTGTAGSYNLEVLVIGGGNSADGNYGGGGGGGASFYTNAYRMGKGMTVSVTVGGVGGSSHFYGLPLVMGGGSGAGDGEYSKGAPGGCGGGGSWQNGRPSGPYASTGNPAGTWGTGTNPAGTYNPVFSITVLGPSYAPYCTITRENTIFHSEGNGNYGTTSAAPNSALGNPLGGYYHHPNAFRARGGGGSAWHGGVGGQGVATKFLSKEASWQWFGSGGSGKPADNYTGRGYETNGHQWRDSIVISGTYYANAAIPFNSGGPRSDSGNDNIPSNATTNAPAGYGGYGSAGSYAQGDYNGSQGIIAIRYDLDAYPGGLAGATGNIFGGTIQTSANGKYRYHFFTTAGEITGTSSNSHTWYIDGNYRPQYFPSDTTNIEWPQRTAPSANTEPFYYYGDIPDTTFQYMIIGGGGSMGTEGGNAPLPSGWFNFGDAFHTGGGGSGGLRTGTFGRTSQGILTYNMSGLPDTLSNTDAGPTSRQTTGAFDMRPGFIEVRANSLLNPLMSPSMYEYSIARNVNTDHRQQNGTIKIRGTFGTGTNQKAKLLRVYQQEEINEGIWGSDTNGSAGPHAHRAWYYFAGGGGNGNPDAPWGDAIYLSNNDYYFYGSNYTRVSAGSLDGTVPANNTYNRAFTLGNWTGPAFGQGTRSASETASYWQSGTATGTNVISPTTAPENYFNACRLNNGYSRYSIGNAHLSSSWSTVWSKVTGAGLNTINNSVDRELTLGANTSASGMNGDPGTAGNEFGGGRRLWVQMVTETSAGAPSRRFEYMELDAGGVGSISLPAGRKFVDTTGDGTSFASFGAPTRTRIRVYKWDLRRIVVRRLFVHDISVGAGGESWRVNPVIRRNGGASYIFQQNEDTPNGFRVAGGGGAGGYNAYYSEVGTVNTATPGNYNGHGNQDYPTIGSGGGGAFIQGNFTWQDDTRDQRGGSNNGSPGGQIEPYCSGGGGGGAVSTLDQNSFVFMGAPRAATTSHGKAHNRNAANQLNTGHGGSGYFGATGYNWHWEVRTISCESPPGVQRPQPTDPYPEYYYSIYVDQYPHNAMFGAGGGGGATDNGNNASTGGGGSGGNGYTSAITGYPQVYGHGGGGFGRRRNGTPGNSMPANPATIVLPVGAPDRPEYYPYGGGGGWTPGRQEGLGLNASGYWPGNAPWPVAYDVSFGQDHMDAMRYWNSPVPAPQKGDLGSAFGGRQGVVIVAYDRAPFIYT